MRTGILIPLPCPGISAGPDVLLNLPFKRAVLHGGNQAEQCGRSMVRPVKMPAGTHRTHAGVIERPGALLCWQGRS
jgi:hypothetical protein